MMKRFLSLLFILPLLLWISCEDEEAEILEGTYDYIRFTVTTLSGENEPFSSESSYAVLTLNEDGTYSLYGNLYSAPINDTGTWSATENKLTINPPTINGFGLFWNGQQTVSTQIWDYTLSNNILSMSCTRNDPDPETNTYYFEKR
jgi:hypothetical protein